MDKTRIIPILAEELKTILKKPEWADYVKTGANKERPPVNPKWWYTRGASMLLKIDQLGPVGVSKLRRKYGGKKNRGVKPESTSKGGGNIIRKIIQQLEKGELVKQDSKGKHKGRVTTPKAKKLINKCSK